MNVGSLFSGIGGIELGFEKAGGFRTLWFVEKEPYAQAILRKHWSKVPIYSDITKIDFTKLPTVDLLTGGFPCQDISNAGKRAGIEGERSGLWKEYLRAISEIRPSYAFIENVSALRNRGLETVLCDLATLGYNAEWHCVPASALGAPHRRDRIYIMAYSNSFGYRRRNKMEQRQEKNGAEIERRSSNTNVADCDSRRLERTIEERWNGRDVVRKGCVGGKEEDVADSNEQMLQRRQQEEHSKRQSEKTIGRRSNTFPNTDYINYWKQRKESLREKNRKETWATDAGVLRVANGISNRVDRIKCLGNAVVPQVAEFFAEIIQKKAGR